ncbi:MAG: hypothetical protein ACP5OO_05990 [Chloroflexia bacterium]
MANLKREVARLEITPEMIEGKYQRHPFLPLMFVVFRHRRAADWFTGTVLSATNVGPDHQLELHHIFPRAVLKEADNFEAYEIDDLANIAFLSQKANRSILKSPPNEYLPSIEKERLEAQLVPLDKGMWRIEKYREFIARRRSSLTDAINEYLGNLGQVWF